MLLCHSMPPVAAITYDTSLSGGGFLGETEDGLVDGLPARVARLAWPTTAGTATDWVSIGLTFSQPAPIRAVALIGVDLLAGVLVEVDLVAMEVVVATASARLVPLPPSNALGVWFVFGAATPSADAIRVRIVNDVAGVALIAANAQIEIGELVAMRVTDIRLESDWSIEPVDPADVQVTRDSQLSVVEREPYRKFTGNLSGAWFTEVYAGGLDGTDWTQLQAALAGPGRCAAIPRWTSDGTTVDIGRVLATAIYGRGAMGTFSHLGGDYYSTQITVQELPAVAPTDSLSF